jgi:hypothetical protein
VQGVRDLRNKEKNQINANLDTGFFRRAGHPYWVCGTKSAIDRQSNSRVTYSVLNARLQKRSQFNDL